MKKGVWKNEKFVMYLKTEINLNCVYSFVSYSSVNTLYLGYRKQQANSVYGNNRCLFWEPYKTHKYTVWPQRVCRIF